MQTACGTAYCTCSALNTNCLKRHCGGNSGNDQPELPKRSALKRKRSIEDTRLKNKYMCQDNGVESINMTDTPFMSIELI